jgi:hypothetical protein
MAGRDAPSRSDPWLGRVRERIVPMCDSCVAGTDVDGGGVALLSSTGVRTVVHTTDEASMALETFQIDLAEGPCVDAGRGLSPVLISDLKNAGEGVSERWPFFLPRADAIGIRGVFAFPLRIGSIVLGTLELYRTSPGKLEARELSTALRAAGDMGAAIVDAGGSPDEGGVGGADVDPADLGRSAASVHQAAGMVMVQLDVTIGEAMARLRARAFADGVPLNQLSADVVRGRRRFTKEQT